MFYFQLKSELWKLFAKKRSYMGFSMFLLAQLLIVLIFRYSNAQQSILRSVSRAGFNGERYLSMLTIATVMVTVLAYTLLPLYVALVGGDFVSKEVEDGTLRMILCRPISRVRLLCVKWLAGFVFACVLVLSLGAFALMFCAIWFPTTGGLFIVIPGQGLAVYEMADGLKHYALAHLFLVAKASTILSLAFMFSCFDMKPAAATVLALSLILIDRILMELPYFQDLQHWFLGNYLNTWQMMFAERIPWWKTGESLSVMIGASLTFVVIGATAFQVRDIKS